MCHCSPLYRIVVVSMGYKWVWWTGQNKQYYEYKRVESREREREEENGEKLKEKRRGILSGKREWGRIKMEGKRYKEIRNEIGEGYHERGEYKIKKRKAGMVENIYCRNNGTGTV